jgi:hypothetical protein
MRSSRRPSGECRGLLWLDVAVDDLRLPLRMNRREVESTTGGAFAGFGDTSAGGEARFTGERAVCRRTEMRVLDIGQMI